MVGLRSKWFNEVLAVRETIEVAMQTHEVYRMNCVLANDLINGVAAASLLLSTTSELVVDLYTRDHDHKLIATRLALVIAAVFTDFVFAVALPQGVQVTFVKDLNTATKQFTDQQMNNDIWFPSAQRQFQQFSLSSTVDIAAAVVFQIGLLHCLMRVQGMVKRIDQMHTTDLTTQPIPPLVKSFDFEETVAFEQRSKCAAFKHEMLRLVPLLHAIVGLSAVIASFCSRVLTQPRSLGCKLAGHEWLKSHPVCLVMEINCYRRQIDGFQNQVGQSFNTSTPNGCFS